MNKNTGKLALAAILLSVLALTMMSQKPLSNVPSISLSVSSGKLIRLLDTKRLTDKWLITWRLYLQDNSNFILLGDFYHFNSTAVTNLVTIKKAKFKLASPDSVDLQFYLPINGSAAARRTFIVASGDKRWQVKSPACPFWDKNFDSGITGLGNNIFSFYFNSASGKIYDVRRNLVQPLKK